MDNIPHYCIEVLIWYFYLCTSHNALLQVLRMELSRVCICIVHLEGYNTRASVQSAQSFYSATSCSIVWVPVAGCSAAVTASQLATDKRQLQCEPVCIEGVCSGCVYMSMSAVDVFRFRL